MNFVKRFFGISQIERAKLLVSGSLFFFIIASYSIAKELQNIIFCIMVGVKYVPIAKMCALFVLLPFIFIDGLLVDRLKRYQVLIAYLLSFTIIGFILNYLLGLPNIGLSNLQQDTSRILGWCFYMYVEGYMVFIIGVFWAFVNSIHKPENAEHTYGFIVSCSKIGGVLAAVFAYLLLIRSSIGDIDTVTKIRLLLGMSSLSLLFSVVVLYIALHKMKNNIFIGYHTTINEGIKRTGATEGLKLILKNSYVIGIFMLTFCCDIMIEVINYQRLLIVTAKTAVHQTNASIGEMAATLYSQIAMMHMTGLILSFFVTNSLMRFLGTRLSLFVTPILILTLMTIYWITGHNQILISLYIVLHAISYSVNTPIRESLYIITSRDIQLKAKFVADALGIKAARGAGHFFNFIVNKICENASHLRIFANNFLFISVISLWFVTATLVGKRYLKAQRNDEVIG